MPAEQTAAGASLSCPHQVLHPQPDEVRGDPWSSPRGAMIFPLGYTSSHQGKHLCNFCPKSSCWVHCRRAVISEAILQRAPASTWSPEEESTTPSTWQDPQSLATDRPVSSNTRCSSRPQRLGLCYASILDPPPPTLGLEWPGN